MKKIYLYIFVGVLAIAGCTKTPSVQEPIVPEEEPSVITPENEAKTVTIKATIEGVTKTTYTEDTGTMKAIVGWEAGDQIKVLYSDGTGGGYSVKDFTTTGDGNFSGTPGEETEGGAYAHVAFYPVASYASIWKGTDKESFYFNFPDEITGSGADMIPMMVYTPNADFELDPVYRFKHTGAVLRFRITNIPSTARKLIITSASHELAGRYYTSYDSTNKLYYYTSGTSEDNGDGGVNAKYSITYNFTPNGDGSYTFYLHHGLTAPSGNFTFTFKNEGGDVICSRTTTLGGLASTTLVRNTMYRINLDAVSFDGYPLSVVTIEPSNLSNSHNGVLPGNAFKSGGFDFYAFNARKPSSSNNIEYNNTGTASIYNSTDFGRIVRIVINKGASTYYRSAFKLYVGSTTKPSINEISYSSYVDDGGNNMSTTYNLATGDYHYFTFLSIDAQYYAYTGSIQIYYKPN